MNQFKGSYAAKTYVNKTGHKALGVSVYSHCLAAGHACKALLSPSVTSPEAIKWIASKIPHHEEVLPFLVACHDIGKLSPGFQAMIRGLATVQGGGTVCPQYGPLRHEVVSYLHMKSQVGAPLAQLLLYHHGSFRNRCHVLSGSNPCMTPHWILKRTSVMNQLARDFGVKSLSWLTSIPTLTPVLRKYLAGLVVVSDWLASDETNFNPAGYKAQEVPTLAQNAIDRHRFRRLDRTWLPPMSFKDLYGFQPNPAQVAMSQVVTGPGLYILEAPMGIGKTEAALYPALDLYRRGIVDGVYFAMPTQVTSNRILLRMESSVQTWLHNYRTHLMHGCADVFHNPKEDDWFKGNKRAILDEFGAGTLDQVLLGVLPQAKYFFLRTMGMYRKAVILDEVHSYDVYTSGLIKALIKDLVSMDCTVIILTATLTAKAKQELLNAI